MRIVHAAVRDHPMAKVVVVDVLVVATLDCVGAVTEHLVCVGLLFKTTKFLLPIETAALKIEQAQTEASAWRYLLCLQVGEVVFVAIAKLSW